MSHQTTSRKLVNALINKIKSDKPMSVEERQSIARDLGQYMGQYMDQLQQEKIRTKKELEKHETSAT